MEEKEADALEMAKEAHEEREKAEKAAQGWVKITNISISYNLNDDFPKII